MLIPLVGAAGFEPATSWSQTRRDDRTTLRPELKFERSKMMAVGARFELAVQLPVRQFSKLLVSATHPSHPMFNERMAKVQKHSVFESFFRIFFIPRK